MKNFTLIIALIFCATSFAQQKITGTVNDDLGSLSGATVILKHKNIGVVTDFEGKFEIEAFPSDTLSVSYVGYHTKEVSVQFGNISNIVIDGSIELDEVTIVAFGSVRVCRVLICGQTCTTSCGVYALSVKSVNDSSNFQPKLFPNPSSDGRFQLTLNENYYSVEFVVTTMTGQTVKTEKSHKVNGNLNIDLSNLPTGIYLINVIADGKRLETKKAIRR